MLELSTRAGRWWATLASLTLAVALSMAGCGNETFPDIDRVPDSISREPVYYPQCPGLNREWLQEPTGLHEADKEVHTLALQWLSDGSGVLFTNGTRLYTAAADQPGLQLLHDAAGEIAVETTGGDTLGRSSTGTFYRSDLTDDSEVTSDGPVRFAAERLTAASIAADGSKIAVAVCRKPAEGQTYGGLAEGGLDVPAGRIWIAISRDLHEIIVWHRGRGTTERLAIGSRPTWSPDGQRLAFLSLYDYTTGARAGLRLYVLDINDGQVWEVAHSAFGAPQWSPDGGRIAFVHGQGPMRAAFTPGNVLRVVKADGVHGSQVEVAVDVVSDPAWSPDGRRLAFAKADGDDVALYTMAADGADLQRIATVVEGWRSDGAPVWRPTYAWVALVAWSPDGAHLLHTCGAHVCVVKADGTPVGQSPVALPNGSLAAWSPDGTRIAVGTVGLNRSSVSVRSGRQVVLYTMAPDGTDEQVLVAADPYARKRLIAVEAEERP